jgi:AcrR family transcriptional regulator
MGTSRMNRQQLEARIRQLELENSRLREQPAVPSRGDATRNRIRECAIDVLAEKGWHADLRDFTEAAGIGNSTFYRHFPGRDELVREVGRQMVQEVYDAALKLQKLDDGREMLVQWVELGFANVHRYGRLAVQVCFPEAVPPYLQDVVMRDALLRFTGWILKKCKEQGHCRSDASTRSMVRTFFALLHPFRIRWCEQEGLSQCEIFEETLQVFIASYATPEAFSSFRAPHFELGSE